ncbi:hypothetical protein H9P43_009148 [Blastocladiella emersonii ATCC 22665]|nr:hypothetical protein H9P43_009148 [Blastocladiella emersonii ATCC 22665]
METDPTTVALEPHIVAVLRENGGRDALLLTRKQLRELLEKRLGGVDLASRKNDIKGLLERIVTDYPEFAAPEEEEEEVDSEEERPPSPPPKPRAAPKAKAKAKAAPKKASAAASSTTKKRPRRAASAKSGDLVEDSDDDDGAGGDGSDYDDRKAKKPRKSSPNNPFNALQVLSPDLAAVIGPDPRPRHQVVKGLWAYIKEHNLQDPNSKIKIVCDGPLKSLFGVDTVHSFTMQKLLSKHLTKMDPAAAAALAAPASDDA